MQNNITYLESMRKTADFSRRCRELMKQKVKFVPIAELLLRLPTKFSYENQWDSMRNGTRGVISFGREINDARFTSTEHLLPRSNYVACIYMNTKWSTTEECIAFCKSQPEAILAGPHGLACAIEHVDKVLPACKLLVSFDKTDTDVLRMVQILSAGKCANENWALSIHHGDWAPGMFFVLFFKA